MACEHHWTVTSECPKCLRQQLEDSKEMLSVLEGAVTLLREAIKALPKYGCCGNHGVCHGTEDANAARAHARRTAGLEVEP